jgi:UTP:GlnB (protein PII) uridylyltransferase
MVMKNPALSDALRNLRQRLSTAFGQEIPLILFGSQARGDFSPDSDVDVLVILPDLSSDSLMLAFDIAWEVGFDAGLVISLTPATANEWEHMGASPFFATVQREGQPV